MDITDEATLRAAAAASKQALKNVEKTGMPMMYTAMIKIDSVLLASFAAQVCQRDNEPTHAHTAQAYTDADTRIHHPPTQYMRIRQPPTQIHAHPPAPNPNTRASTIPQPKYPHAHTHTRTR